MELSWDIDTTTRGKLCYAACATQQGSSCHHIRFILNACIGWYFRAPVEICSCEDRHDCVRGRYCRVSPTLLQLVVHVPENSADAKQYLPRPRPKRGSEARLHTQSQARNVWFSSPRRCVVAETHASSFESKFEARLMFLYFNS